MMSIQGYVRAGCARRGAAMGGMVAHTGLPCRGVASTHVRLQSIAACRVELRAPERYVFNMILPRTPHRQCCSPGTGLCATQYTQRPRYRIIHLVSVDRQCSEARRRAWVLVAASSTTKGSRVFRQSLEPLIITYRAPRAPARHTCLPWTYVCTCVYFRHFLDSPGVDLTAWYNSAITSADKHRAHSMWTSLEHPRLHIAVDGPTRTCSYVSSGRGVTPHLY